YRLKGELTLKQSSVQSLASSVQAEAEACFQQAIAIARQQSAKSLELRAGMSLSRLWQRQGKKDEARQMLAGVYGWLHGGFDTADLKDAKALLEGVSRTLDGKLSDALGKMRAGPSEPPFRRRLQTAPGCGV